MALGARRSALGDSARHLGRSLLAGARMRGERDAFCVVRSAWCVSRVGTHLPPSSDAYLVRYTVRITHHAQRITLPSHPYLREERPAAMPPQ